MTLEVKSIEKKNRIRMCCIIFAMVSILSMVLIPYTECKAASASVTLSSDKSSVIIGDQVIVSMQLSSEALLGDFEAYIAYNADILEFQSGASFVAGGEGLLKLSDTNVEDGEYTRKYIIKFNAKEIGNSDITINEKASIYDFETGLDMSVSTNRINISVVAAETASTNANLTTLKISPSVLTPDFDPNITEYSTQITKETERLIISALPEEKEATVTIQGNDNLIVGTNKIIVTVKAESGDTKEYTIEAVRESISQTEETVESDETENSQGLNPTEQNNLTQINHLLVTQEGENIYIQNGYKYSLGKTKDTNVTIPEGYIQTTIILNEITVNAYTPENNLESEFLLLYAINEQGEEGFYQYDRIEKTLQRYTDSKNSNSINKYVMTNEMIRSEEYKTKITTMAIIIAILGAVLITMSVILLRIYMKPKPRDD